MTADDTAARAHEKLRPHAMREPSPTEPSPSKGDDNAFSRVTAPSVALVVRCFNEEAHIGRLLTGALAQTHPPEEIVVVDSGSTDSTLSIASTFDVQIVELAPDLFSFGHALNVGIESTDAEIALLASAHVYPIYDTWVEALIAPFDDESVALTYGRQQPPPDGRLSEQRLLSQWFPAQSARRQRHPFCNNANAAIRRSAWETRPYDEHLTGLEDLEWAKCVMESGYSLAYVAEAPVIHVHNESLAQVFNRYRREAIAHKEIYHEQEMGVLTATRLVTANIVGDYREALRTRQLRANLVDIPGFRAAQFLGTYRGFAQSGPVTATLKRRFYYPSAGSGVTTDRPANRAGRAIDYDEGRP